MKSSVALKLLEVQRELGAVKKGKQNPFFSSNYADINQYISVLKPILNKVGLVLLQPLTMSDGSGATSIGLNTIVVDSETGEEINYKTDIYLKDTDPQKVGSAITYYRRYALQSFFFVEAEDDDANKASGKVARKVTNDDLPF